MFKTIHAVYKQGILKPLGPIEGIEEDTEVEIIVSTGKKISTSLLRFAGILDEEDANKMIKIIDEEFERVNQSEWQD